MFCNFLTSNDYNTDDELVLRREIAANGKISWILLMIHRANLNQLKTTGFDAGLILHQQFDTLELGDADFSTRSIRYFIRKMKKLLFAIYFCCLMNGNKTQQQLENLITQKNSFQKRT